MIRVFSVVVFVSLLTAFEAAAQLVAQPIVLTPPEVTAKSVYAVDLSNGRVIWEKNINEKRPVASTQKLMTALLITESGNLDEMVPVKSTDGRVEPRNMWITQGSSYKKRLLLEVMLMRSYNDVTKCLARHRAGSQGEFATLMNAKAAELGMDNSHFVNAHGLTEEGQYSTARDMMILAAAAYSTPEIRRIVQIKDSSFKYDGGKSVPVKNSNELLHSYSECAGMKTGFTKAAGRCLIAAAIRGDKTVLAVVLGSNFDDVWTDSETVLRWSLDN